MPDDGGAAVNEEPNRSLLWPAVLVGIGVAGSLDEIVLHQLLRWHHFFDRGSQAAGLIADGIFHLYDGIIQHKLLGLHQVRAGAPNNLPYDLGFIGLAAVILLAGLLLLRVAGSPRAAPGENRS
jgi:uncharacterized membrane protein